MVGNGRGYDIARKREIRRCLSIHAFDTSNRDTEIHILQTKAMTQILIISNPFDPTNGTEKHLIGDGLTAREWLAERFGPQFVEFDRPTVLQWNGELVMRSEWETRRMIPGDNLAFVHVPGGVLEFLVIPLIVGLIVGIAAYLLMPDPKIPGDTTASDSVYTLRGQSNRFRPNEPIEVIYGKVRHWPTYATRPYSEYIGNQQYQYSLYCVGQGEYDIEEMRLDDTVLTDFPEVETEIVNPGEALDLIEANVFTAVEVSNIELLGPNEDDYAGASGPYIINDFDDPIKRIAVDVAFPQGLYKLNSNGGLASETVELLFEYRRINADGSPYSGAVWTTLINPTITLNDNTPQRITYSSATITEGRYEIRGQRITDKPDSTRQVSQARWESAKGFAKMTANFGNVTLIAMKALATNSLNDSSAKRFNITATRKLPIYNSGTETWGAVTATRNPIWAFCDLFRAEYGAKLEDTFLDLPTLTGLAATYETREDWFDWVFDGPMAIWEAAKMILRVGRAMPIPQGSLITAVRDVEQTLPAGIFNQHNIIKGSLKKSLQMFEFQPFDGVIVEYNDPDTWETKEVECVLPGRAGLNLDRVKFPGCSNRNKAYREGLYIQSRRELQRKTVSFQTGLEGHIPAYMDLISVTHDTVRVGQGGMILAYNTGTNEMTLSEQVHFAGSAVVHKIAIRGDDGAILGTPITVTAGSAPNKVILASDPSPALDFSENRTPPLYAFGVADIWAFMGKVTAIKPIDQNTVEITCKNYVPASYGYDEEDSIAVTEYRTIRNPNNPQVAWVTLSPVPDKSDRVYIDWQPVAGAASYMLQSSYDAGASWSNVGNFVSPPVEIGTSLGSLTVRVAPFALNGNVRWTESAAYVVGSNIDAPEAPEAKDPQPAFTGLTATAKWLAVTGAFGYEVDIIDFATSTLLRTVNVGTALKVQYTFAQYTDDGGTGRGLDFNVRSYNDGGYSGDTLIPLENPVPSMPGGPTTGTPSGDDYPVSWSYTPEGDELEFRLYGSTSPGFTADGSTLLSTTTDPYGTITTATTPYYWRVGVVDVWGDEVTLSDEVEIP